MTIVTYLLLIKVGQTDRFYLALLVCLLHETVSCDIIACRLVNQQQIDVIRIQSLKCLFHSVSLLIERRPDFRLQENILSGNLRLFHGSADSLFRGILSSVYVRFYEIASIFIREPSIAFIPSVNSI